MTVHQAFSEGDFAALLRTRVGTDAAWFPSVGGRRLLGSRAAVPETSARTKIWELDSSLHCSIVGTCLGTGELRSVLRRFGAIPPDDASDHRLHSIAVSAVGTRSDLAKQLQKALDRRHGAAIRRFQKASAHDGLVALWEEARRSGEIPGAYWALLTHPAASEATVRRAFGDVHMLSHLVGAANRADIRRLHAIEEEKAALEEKLARQQARLREEIVARDARIRELGTLLAERIAGDATPSTPAATPTAALEALVADLRKRLDQETHRRERAERRAAELATAERRSAGLERDVMALGAELAAAEAELTSLGGADAPEDALDLRGVTILYVGGRPHQVAHYRRFVERALGGFIHHDGGIEERRDLLAGLLSRADAAVFPVDCISHDAALNLKRLCRQAEKPMVPLRGSGIAALLSGLRRLERAPAAVGD